MKRQVLRYSHGLILGLVRDSGPFSCVWTSGQRADVQLLAWMQFGKDPVHGG